MPFVANVDGHRVDISTLKEPRIALRGKQISCRVCDHPMHAVESAQRLNHFRHNPHADCRLEEMSHPETMAHLMGKKYVHDLLVKKYPNARIECEYIVEAADRVADVAMIDGAFITLYEVQLSPIPKDDIDERTRNYRHAGCEVHWFFGPKFWRDSAYQWRDVLEPWLLEVFGEALRIEFDVRTFETSWEDMIDGRHKEDAA